MNKLSVVIITFNEEANIGRCIDSIHSIADEIFVVDSFSTDRTVDIAVQKGARVMQNEFEGHIQQKNWARLKAQHDWILSIDADEYVSDELLASLKEWKRGSLTYCNGYYINRLNFYCGTAIRTCGLYPDKKLRLWRRKWGEWSGINPHDKFVLKFDMDAHSPIRLEGDIIHNTWPTHAAFLQQIEKFATIGARHLKGKNIFYLITKMTFSPVFKFIRNYFFYLGFTDGKVGFIICFNQSREVFLKYFRAIKFKYA